MNSSIHHLVCGMHQFYPNNSQKAKRFLKKSSKFSHFRRWNQQIFVFDFNKKSIVKIVSYSFQHNMHQKAQILHAQTKYKLAS